jgi:hypothetical protein
MRYYAPFFKPLRHIPLLNELFVHRIALDITKYLLTPEENARRRFQQF